MDKVKTYLKIGKVLIWLWFVIVLSFGLFLFFSMQPSKADFLSLVKTAFMVTTLLNISLNPLLLIGGIFLWRSERNKIPPRQSFWFIFIILVSITGIFFHKRNLKIGEQITVQRYPIDESEMPVQNENK